ncbi:hypothetical protein AB0I28_33870 [Phytomonospora sp. NPDC050363]|uniref:hypothetical protein n=1 Tax=Phytomonospora sp. NPDC050363 TaxID=3155642 RepID=UPI0033CE8BF6
MKRVLIGLSTVALAVSACVDLGADDGEATGLDETSAYTRAEEHITAALAVLDPGPAPEYVGASSQNCGDSGFGDDTTTRVGVTYALPGTADFSRLEAHLSSGAYEPHDDGVFDPEGPFAEAEDRSDGFVVTVSTEDATGRLLLRARSPCVAVTGASHSPRPR